MNYPLTSEFSGASGPALRRTTPRHPWVPILWQFVVIACLGAALMVFAPAQADADGVLGIAPDARTQLIVHKVEQPHDFGAPATGLPLDQASLDQLVPVPGVTFRATRVPGIDLTTNDGWTSASRLTVATAATMTEQLVPEASGRTDGDGLLRLDLGVGLYLVEEADNHAEHAPEGVVPSAPFLVTLPMTDPAGGDTWLDTVHVYPKNAHAGVELDVSEAITCVPEVTWTSRSSVPRVTHLDRYVVQNVVAPTAEFLGGSSAVGVAIDGAPALSQGTHYTVALLVPRGAGQRTVIETAFTEAGRAVLLAARDANPDAEVTIAYSTRLLAPGTHQSDVRLSVDDAKDATGTAAATYKQDCGPSESPSPSPTPSRSMTPTTRPDPSPTPTAPPPVVPKPPKLSGTGAQVGGVVLVAAVVLIGGGLALVRRGRRGREDE